MARDDVRAYNHYLGVYKDYIGVYRRYMPSSNRARGKRKGMTNSVKKKNCDSYLFGSTGNR